VEQPNFKDTFSAGDTVHIEAYLRDLLATEAGTIQLLDPDNIVLLSVPFSLDDSEYAAAASVGGPIDTPGNAIPGAYTLRVSYAGQTRDHTFYINAGPPPTPTAQVSNNAQNGLFFDADLDGEGYNFVTTPAGTIIYFYGSDADGNRLWLISDLIRGDFGPGATIEVTMFESSGGTFAAPVASTRGLSIWGALILDFSDCDSATAVLVGEDGEKVSQLTKLAGASGTACVGGAVRADAPWTGLWYDPSDDGEGYNVIVAPNGVILYYYGFASNGRRLWLISDLITAELQVGVAVEIEVYEATQGTFDNPAPSSQLVQWGTATITLHDCGGVTIVLEGDDGNKTSSTLRLASVIGLNCSD
jgi:hypothetical protein